MASNDHFEAGRAALAVGRWDDARAAFEASVAERETPEALESLGAALWWLCEARASVRCRERAFVLFRQAGELGRACAVAVDLVITYLVNLGNGAAARGWLGRAERVGRELGHNPMQGWLWLMQGYLSPDPDRARELLERALESARDAGDPDLELVSLGDLGLSLVAAGKIEEGMALLDEAMAGSFAGECDRLETVVYNGCNMLAACQLAGDVERAAQWCRVADDFMRDYTSPFLFARCRVHYGGLLVTKGEWDRAESELRAALDMAEDAGPGPKTDALAGLAELRVRQGRLEEAKELLDGCDEAGAAALPAAELRLAQGEPAAAAALLEKRLSHAGDNPIEAAPLLALLVDAHVACGDLDAAEEAAARLGALARDNGGDHPAALSALASAHVLGAKGRSDEAIDRFEEALHTFSGIDLPFEEARVRLELARPLSERRPVLAAVEAKGALRGFEAIGATAYADQAASLLRSLGQRVGLGARSTGILTDRQRQVLQLVGLGLSNPEIAERLFISRKTAAHHVSNLLTRLGMKNRAELVAYATRTGARDEPA